MQAFKHVVSWIFAIISAVGVLIAGPELLLAPALLSAFSTDSPLTPDYVPYLVFYGGYGIEVIWSVLLFFAIRTIVRSFKKEEREKIPVLNGEMDDLR